MAEIDKLLENQRVDLKMQLELVRTFIEERIKILIPFSHSTTMAYLIPYNVAGTLIKHMPSFRRELASLLEKTGYRVIVCSKRDDRIWISWASKLKQNQKPANKS